MQITHDIWNNRVFTTEECTAITEKTASFEMLVGIINKLLDENKFLLSTVSGDEVEPMECLI